MPSPLTFRLLRIYTFRILRLAPNPPISISERGLGRKPMGTLSNQLLERPDTVLPNERDAELATESSRVLSSVKDPTDIFRVHLENGEELVLPAAVRTLLMHVLTEMSRGNAVTLVPIHAELTTQEAADYLNVSRPHLISLLETQAIPFRKVGTHRRIKFHDLKAYAERIRNESETALTELAAQAQELKMGY